jgi:heme/copper-type cytochrome/quinol oxidase subunit 2
MNPFDQQPPESPNDQQQQPVPLPITSLAQPITVPAAAQISASQQAQTPIQPQSNTLAIVGLILAIIANLIGLIISIVAFVKSKKTGKPNNIALAGIIVGSVTTLIGLISTIFLVTAFISYYTDASTKTMDASRAQSLVGSTVELSGSTVEAPCYTFDMPENYILSPNASQCQAELRLGNNTSTGVALTAIFVKAQTGDSTVKDFISLMKKSGATETGTVTIAGITSGKAVIPDGLDVPQTLYFIPDSSGSFTTTNGAITSYLIYGPTGLTDALNTVINSFSLR